MMKFSNIAMLVIMLSPMVGCEEKTSGENSKEQALSKKLNESTPFDQINWDELSTTPPVLSPDEAIAKLQKEAKSGNADAQYNLGIMYYIGEGGVSKDYIKAHEWWKKAAGQGNADAQYTIGKCYENGEGVTKDDFKAFKWWQKAAEQGNAQAQENIAMGYLDGNVVPKDDTKAVMWLQKAAENGLAQAQYNLGVMYRNGKGVSKSMMLSYVWFNLAAAQGDENAQANRDSVEEKLTAAERSEGQKLASNWKKVDGFEKPNKYNPLDSVVLQSASLKLIKQGVGTAFVMSNENHALTNHHVISGCVEVKIAGHEGVAKVITSDSVNDLALLQLPGKNDDYAKLNPDIDKLRQGEDVIVFGYPLNSVLSSGGNLTPGTLSALTGLGNNTNQIQITAPIQPGSSGSPVMDKKGNIVAMVSMKLDDGKMAQATGQIGQNVNFAVNGQTVKSFLELNKVPYKTGGGFFSMEKSTASIAEEAHKWTVLVECWK
jgi:TPR repeat protein